jgi:hypothetical protein
MGGRPHLPEHVFRLCLRGVHHRRLQPAIVGWRVAMSLRRPGPRRPGDGHLGSAVAAVGGGWCITRIGACSTSGSATRSGPPRLGRSPRLARGATATTFSGGTLQDRAHPAPRSVVHGGPGGAGDGPSGSAGGTTSDSMGLPAIFLRSSSRGSTMTDRRPRWWSRESRKRQQICLTPARRRPAHR